MNQRFSASLLLALAAMPLGAIVTHAVDLRWADGTSNDFGNLNHWATYQEGVIPSAPTGNVTTLTGNVLRVYNNSILNYDGAVDYSIDRLYLNNNAEGADGTVVQFLQDGGTLTHVSIQLGRENSGANAASATYLMNGGTLTGGDIVFGSGTANKFIVNNGTVITTGFKQNDNNGHINIEINGGIVKSSGQTGHGTPARTGGVTDIVITGGAFETKELRFGGAGAIGNISITNNGALRIGTAELSGNNSYLPHSGGQVTINMADTAEFTVGSQIGTFGLAQDENSKAFITLSGSSSFTRKGTGAFTIGKGKNAVGEITLQNSASFTTEADFRFGNAEGAIVTADFTDSSTFNATKADGRVILLDGVGAAKTTVSVKDNATFTVANDLVIGHYNNNNTDALATLTIGSDAAGNAVVNAKTLTLGRYDNDANSPNSVVNVNAGGTLSVEKIQKGGGLGKKTINFDGGTLRALAAQTEFFTHLRTAGDAANTVITVNLQEGGLVFDTQGFAIGTAQKLSGTGDLTKVGTGTLTLSGDQSGWTGALNVTEGAVELAGATVLSIVLDGAKGGTGAVDAETLHGTTGGMLTLADGATLNVVLNNAGSLGVGTYTYNIFTGNVSYDAGEIVLTTASSGAITYTLNGNGTLTVQVVPEPSTYGLLFGAGALLCAVRLRRSR